MFVFRADPWVLDDHLVYSSLGKTISFTLSIPSLPIVLSIGLWHHGVPPHTLYSLYHV